MSRRKPGTQGAKVTEAEYNGIMMSFILWTPHQTQLGWSNQEGWNRQGTWHEQERRKIHTKFWPENMMERTTWKMHTQMEEY